MSIKTVVTKIVMAAALAQPFASSNKYSISVELGCGSVQVSIFDTQDRHNRVYFASVHIISFDLETSKVELEAQLSVIEKYSKLNQTLENAA